MAHLVLRGIAPDLLGRLKWRAERNHRSMANEAVAILEKELSTAGSVTLPDPIAAEPPLTAEEIAQAIRARDE